MTIGIAAHGPNAGAAILHALASAEKICSGAIGGFVSAAALTGERLERVETQSDGSAGLRFRSNRSRFECADVAGLISSGPNRPEPLSAFVSALPGVGIVTGHRMPNAIGRDGNPMNQSVLRLLAAGVDPQNAISKVISANPGADCGLIAVNRNRQGYAANTISMDRPDAGMASGSRCDASVWVLHNALRPSDALAPLIVELALDVMQPALRKNSRIIFNKGCLVKAGVSPRIYVNEHNTVEAIVAKLSSTTQRFQALDIGYRPPVLLNGKAHARLLYEPLLIADTRKLISADGQTTLQVEAGMQPEIESRT